ncbi:probable C-mannosyltransferase DPY19L3 [Physella acuta]|uniref:probable C-mannosyltransferase DPY19L3 n=1 Tax=Physella acuta TaxID=109671 RepID=UPI0027DB63EB|nr:probable C-mannosyltransferase DPY19L3 [Physella acuta]
MTNKQKKRSNAAHYGSKSFEPDNGLDASEGSGKMKNRHSDPLNLKEQKQGKTHWSISSIVNVTVGLVVMVALSYTHSCYMWQLHENKLWFTNIQEVEREISFRTESGLYYSYFKQLVNTESFSQGMKELVSDKLTEHPDTINILARMNVYQEVILAFLYRTLGISMQPIMFYIDAVFVLHALLISGIYVLAWALSNTWLAGVLSAAFYIFNRLDTTRVDHSIPLRESFSLPFLWLQAAALTIYLKPNMSPFYKRCSLCVVALSTFFFCLFWQFNQFIMMLQAFSLFGGWILNLLPPLKVRNIMLCQLFSLLIVYLLQFGNSMIIGSLAVSFLLVSLGLLALQSGSSTPHSIVYHIFRVILLSLISLLLMFVLNHLLKLAFSVDGDEHIFKFLMDKFSSVDTREFDSRIYLCLGIFGFITWDVFERLTNSGVLPLYAVAHFLMLLYLIYTVIRKWRSQSCATATQTNNGKGLTSSQDKVNTNLPCFEDCRPDLAFHTIQAVFFGALAIFTLRMKYFWTPYICVLASVGLSDETMWITVFHKFAKKSLITIAQYSTIILAISALTGRMLPSVLSELENKYEFWDPHTVELMEWISNSTNPSESFTGSMQLLAGVKLCTMRPVTNHPHYEDKLLRFKTKQLYQIYGRRRPEDVHAILKTYESSYIILEDSICRAPSRGGCRTPDLVDIDNGVMPDDHINIPGLVESRIPRFCENVRHQTPEYAKYFKAVFENPTFRVYKVM